MASGDHMGIGGSVPLRAVLAGARARAHATILHRVGAARTVKAVQMRLGHATRMCLALCTGFGDHTVRGALAQHHARAGDELGRAHVVHLNMAAMIAMEVQWTWKSATHSAVQAAASVAHARWSLSYPKLEGVQIAVCQASAVWSPVVSTHAKAGTVVTATAQVRLIARPPHAIMHLAAAQLDPTANHL